jgi:hypothetical protein
MMPIKVANFLILFAVAVVAAKLLATIAVADLGLSPNDIREAALLCSGFLGIGLYSDRFGRRK